MKREKALLNGLNNNTSLYDRYTAIKVSSYSIHNKNILYNGIKNLLVNIMGKHYVYEYNIFMMRFSYHLGFYLS